ncbi:outer membrane protein assembly factor BamB family protein [Gimesia aquarii]|uniref:Serine/threonine-protein kinase AfsK n=1 Tax=Gimesia aquarii TaxID=2527964 RepID=A0A517VXX2_9PLAN|nr:PQQ-binding-like beta-propeller repeat protein [Gimesia aquarii]QDT97841.1 Serine/threonine-protein kinase AfsK [Gimesia aquarii]
MLCQRKTFIYITYCCLLLCVLSGGSGNTEAADWPMWRGNIERTGVTSEVLPEKLYPGWSRRLPAYQVAWPNEERLQFDFAYEPVAVGNHILVGSPLEGSLTSYDAKTGDQRWKFYTNGPARFAPIVSDQNVIFGSDDGFLYCLNLADGKLRWKIKGAPDTHQERWHLGNDRLISYWPIRGAPVVKEGVVFFGAGIWPSMGTYLSAVDIKTGKRKWINQRIQYLKNVRIDHNYLHEAGLSPQGYCLIANQMLVVPNGRSMPARIDPETGKMHYFVQGYRNGDSRVIAAGDYLLVGHSGVVNLADGREVGNRWVDAGKDAPKSWSTLKRDQFEGPFDAYKSMPGCSFRSVYDQGICYGVDKGVVYAYDLSQATKSLYEKKHGAQTVKPAKWEAPLLWKLDTGLGKDETHSIIKAGNTLYAHVGKTLFAAKIAKDQKSAKVIWQHKLTQPVGSLIVANQRLIVSCLNGYLHCFQTEPQKHKWLKQAHVPLPRISAEDIQLAFEYLDASSIKVGSEGPLIAGYIVIRGIESESLPDALRQVASVRTIVIEDDIELVKRLRKKFHDVGVYNGEVQIIHADPDTFPLPHYLADLVIDPTPAAKNAVALPQKLKSVRPYGGVACLKVNDANQTLIEKMTSSLDKAHWKVQRQNDLVVLQRKGALPGSSDWTHECSDAARSYFSRDQLVKAPLGILWYGDGPGYGFHKFKDYGRGVKPQVGGGRLVAFDDRAKRLTAIDAYTGRLLWNFDTGTTVVRFATLPHAIIVGRNSECVILNPEDGSIIKTLPCKLDPKLTGVPGVVDVRVDDPLILVAIGFDLPKGHSHPAIETGLWDAKTIVAFDRKSGKQLWSIVAKERFNIHSLVLGNDLVFCTDSISPLKADQMKRRGTAPETFTSEVLALDPKHGTLKWKFKREYGHRVMTGRGPLAIRPYDDWSAFSEKSQLLYTGKLKEMQALNATTGKKVWEKPIGLQPLLLYDDSFINQAGVKYDLFTGKQISKKPLFKRSGCNYTVGNQNLLFLRNNCAAYVDMDQKKEFSLRNLRSGCSNSLVAANGLLSIPCFSTGCICNYPLQTSFGMVHMPEVSQWTTDDPIDVKQLRDAQTAVTPENQVNPAK